MDYYEKTLAQAQRWTEYHPGPSEKSRCPPITGLTLASDTPGTLTVSWDAASPTPTDYRVDWAKSDEDYQSWKVDEGHKYLAPTINGRDHHRPGPRH